MGKGKEEGGGERKRSREGTSKGRKQTIEDKKNVKMQGRYELYEDGGSGRRLTAVLTSSSMPSTHHLLKSDLKLFEMLRPS